MTTANNKVPHRIAAVPSRRRSAGRPRLQASVLRGRQRGMGATIILFTIALIVLVGAALAYASRGNPSAINTQGARVYSGVILKQSADYRDAYSRFVFDGGNASTMTFNIPPLAVGDLFNPTAQYGTYQAPPPQSMNGAAAAVWLYNKQVVVNGVGTTAAESVTYVPDVSLAVCEEINNQLYGGKTIPTSATVASSALVTNGTVFDATPVGRAAGCFQTSDGKYVVYATLGEA